MKPWLPLRWRLVAPTLAALAGFRRPGHGPSLRAPAVSLVRERARRVRDRGHPPERSLQRRDLAGGGLLPPHGPVPERGEGHQADRPAGTGGALLEWRSE